jgi:hypothetical protein
MAIAKRRGMQLLMRLLLLTAVDTALQVRAKLQGFRGGEIGNAPFKIVKQTGAGQRMEQQLLPYCS